MSENQFQTDEKVIEFAILDILLVIGGILFGIVLIPAMIIISPLCAAGISLYLMRKLRKKYENQAKLP